MKKDVKEWIDKEVDRLDREIEGESPESSTPEPVPDALREALGKTAEKKSSSGN